MEKTSKTLLFGIFAKRTELSIRHPLGAAKDGGYYDDLYTDDKGSLKAVL